MNSEAIIFHKGNNLSRCSLISCIFLSCCIVLHPLENGSVHAVQFLKGFNSICSSWCKRSRWSTVQNQALCCKKGISLAARPELLINNRIYLPLFSFSRPSQTLQLEVLHQHPQTNLHQNTHRYQAQHLDPATKLSIWFNPLSLKFGCLDVGYQIMSGSSGIKPIILVCACVCACVANTGASRPLPRAIAGQRNIRQSKQSCFFSRFSTCAFVLNWLQNLFCLCHHDRVSFTTFPCPSRHFTRQSAETQPSAFVLLVSVQVECSTSFRPRLKRTMSKNRLTKPANLPSQIGSLSVNDGT